MNNVLTLLFPSMDYILYHPLLEKSSLIFQTSVKLFHCVTQQSLTKSHFGKMWNEKGPEIKSRQKISISVYFNKSVFPLCFTFCQQH